jgi:hypothetical protein
MLFLLFDFNQRLICYLFHVIFGGGGGEVIYVLLFFSNDAVVVVDVFIV